MSDARDNIETGAPTGTLADPRDERIADLEREISLLKTELRFMRDHTGDTLVPRTDDLQHEQDAFSRYAEDLLTQLESVMHLQVERQDLTTSGFIAAGQQGRMRVLAARGEYASGWDRDLDFVLGHDELEALLQELDGTGQLIGDDFYSSRFKTHGGLDCLLYLESSQPLGRLDKGLILLIAGNAKADFDTIHANQDIVDAQKEIIQTLGDVVESRSKETANHTVRVAEYSFLLARLAGLSLQEARILQFAAPMHDVGKIGITDSVLHKPGKLTPAEMDLIRTHADIGHDILAKSERTILKTAALVAHQHHEKWDGTGYPQGLRGGEIHIYGRIVAIADVFDALATDRVYRKAMSLERILVIFREERGRHFEPRLVDLFLENFERFVAIRDRYADLSDPLPVETDPCVTRR